MENSTCLLLYMPAFHAGYARLLDESDVDVVILLTEKILQCTTMSQRSAREFPLEGKTIEMLVNAYLRFKCSQLGVLVAYPALLEQKWTKVVAMEHEVVRDVIKHYMPDCPVEFRSAFLRWDLPSAMSNVVPNAEKVPDNLAWLNNHNVRLEEVANKSDNAFRTVGAMLFRTNGTLLLEGYNRGGEYYGEGQIIGNPRVWLDGGSSEINPDLHAEQDILMQALNEGIDLSDCILLVNTFPCRTCANLIAQTKLKKLVYRNGYSVLAGYETLVGADIQVWQL